MKRRKLLLDTIKALPVIIISPTLLSSCYKEEDDAQPFNKSVIVVGAGISGLAAANKLREKGFQVTVLEAQEKIGGRLRTDRSLGIAFDEGASWIHGPNGNPITPLAAEAGANTFLTDDDSSTVYDANGTEYADSFVVNQEAEFNTALSAVSNASNQNQSFETVFNSLYPAQANNRFWKYMLSAYFEFNLGGDISNISSKYFDYDMEFLGKDVIITNGYDKIADLLGQGLEIQLNTRVTAIDYAGAKTKVTANGNTLEADYLIVSVPLGVLKNNTISFTPTLPQAKLEAIQRTNMGNVNKFLLTWSAPFWDTTIQYVGYTPDTKGKFNYFMNLNKFAPNSNALMTFAFGNYATATEAMNDAEVIQEIMLHLKSIYGNTIPEPTQMLRTKWGQNENSYGAYSYATNGNSIADFDALELEVNDKLFFAGEHTETDYRATVHGAYLSGIREADKILNLL